MGQEHIFNQSSVFLIYLSQQFLLHADYKNEQMFPLCSYRVITIN